jgi:hypothetical protein
MASQAIRTSPRRFGGVAPLVEQGCARTFTAMVKALSVLAATLAVMLGPGAAGAAADWSPATRLAANSSTVTLLGLDYARDSTGLAAWTAATSGGLATQIAARPNGGAWGRPRTIGVARTSSSTGAVGVQPGAVAALGSGRVAMLGIVTANGGATARVVGYLLTTDGKLVKTTTLVSGLYANVVRWGGVALDGDGAGKGVAVIGVRDTGVYVSRVSASSGFSTPKRIAKASFRIPAVAAGGRSTVAVAWNDGSRERAMLSSDGGKTFGSALKLGKTAGAAEQGGNPVAAVSSAGAVLVGWGTQSGERETASYDESAYRYAYRRAGSSGFEPSVTLYRENLGEPVGPIEVAFDGNGDPLVTWLGRVLDRSVSPAVRPVVLAAEARPAGPAMVQRLSAGFGRPASLAGGAGTNAAVSWVVVDSSPDFTTVAVDASLRDKSGGFGATERVSGSPTPKSNTDALLAYRRDGKLTALYIASPSPRDNSVLVADRP